MSKIEKDIAALEHKRAKLVDMRLEEIIDKETYEQKYFDLSSQIDQLQRQREDLQQSAETESTMKRRISEFRKTLEQNEVLDAFDRYVFESIVEKVIVGGYDEDGNKDPSMLTFIYKTGLRIAWTVAISNHRERIVKQQNNAPVCVPIQPTRQKKRVPIIVTTHVETVVLLSRGEID